MRCEKVMLQDIKIFGFSELKEIHRERRENFKEEFSLRIHRGLSWVQRAEKELEDPDASFIFYWIAFNSIYADIEIALGLATQLTRATTSCPLAAPFLQCQ